MSSSPLGTAIPSINDLQQNVTRLLQQQLLASQQAAGPSASLGVSDLDLARSNIKALAFVKAVGLHGAYRYLRDFIARQAIPIKSSGEFLDGWLATYGMARKEAAAATGVVQGTGVQSAVLTAGTLMQTSDGRQYRVTDDAIAQAGGVVVGPNYPVLASVMALVAGSSSNLTAGSVLSLVSPVPGIDASFSVIAPGIAGGADIESDAQAIYRLQQRLSNEPRGGSPADYARWALQCPGITRAWGLRNPAGPTTAGVVILADGNAPYGIPTEGQAAIVRDYIRDPKRGPPDELFVIVPKPVVVNFSLRVVPDRAAVRAGVVTALQDLFFREAAPGGSIPHTHVTEAISGVTGEQTHSIGLPVIYSGGEFSAGGIDRLLVLGSVTFV